jgi:hypothetical protein
MAVRLQRETARHRSPLLGARWWKKAQRAKRVIHVRPSTTLRAHRALWKEAKLGAVKQGAKTCNRGNVWAGKKISIVHLLSVWRDT